MRLRLRGQERAGGQRRCRQHAARHRGIERRRLFSDPGDRGAVHALGLRERFARGEIDENEYEARKRTLTRKDGP